MEFCIKVRSEIQWWLSKTKCCNYNMISNTDITTNMVRFRGEDQHDRKFFILGSWPSDQEFQVYIYTNTRKVLMLGKKLYFTQIRSKLVQLLSLYRQKTTAFKSNFPLAVEILPLSNTISKIHITECNNWKVTNGQCSSIKFMWQCKSGKNNANRILCNTN